jgi:hypothetical protein
MHNHEHKSKHKDHKELAQKLQSEVDVILAKISDKMLFAEFREDEVFTIQNGEKQEEVVRNTLDERILIRRTPQRESAFVMIDRQTTQAAEKISAFGRLFQYLFKPLHY